VFSYDDIIFVMSEADLDMFSNRLAEQGPQTKGLLQARECFAA